MKNLIITFLLISLSMPCFAQDLNEEVRDVIQNAHKKAFALQIKNEKWDMPSYLGNNWTSAMYLFLKWNGEESLLKPSDIEKLKNELLKTQKSNGGWTPIEDANTDLSEVSASVMNYFALKVMGVSPKNSAMVKARTFIISKGGIEKSNLLTKIFLCLFDNYSWKEVPKIPLILFGDTPLKLIAAPSKFAQWIGPNIMPMAYLKKYQVHKNLGERYELKELLSTSIKINNKQIALEKNDQMSIKLIQDLVRGQKAHGSFGAYTPATFFSYMAITHYEKLFPSQETLDAKSRALSFLKNLTIRKGSLQTEGLVDDGHVWDTALVSLGLLRTEASPNTLRKTGDYLVSMATKEGGYPFGFDFEEYPDTDDTAVVIMSLHEIGGYEAQINKATQWLLSMQNRDGGWGAFARNNNGNMIVKAFANDFVDSADLFDESSPDVTGHILEALGKLGYTKDNSEHVRKAINYLKKELKKSDVPAWMGRWGINYIYGTGAALVGLASVQEPMDAPYIQNVRDWLLSKQNKDGGFGETTKSYLDSSYAGVGISTPSQSAWGLLGLLKTVGKEHPASVKAVRYLVKEFNQKGKWIDGSTVGTGHPEIIYMNYPAYPVAFPLIALGEYLEN